MNSNSQLFSLRWNNYLDHVTGAFENLRSGEDFVDVTLSCEGKKIKAHKMLLSAFSSYFKEIFKDNPCQHPVIVFRNVRYTDLVALVHFIYQGEVNVVQEQLSSFLATAQLLAVKGLTDSNNDVEKNKDELDFEEETTSTARAHSTDCPVSLKRLSEADDVKLQSANKKRIKEDKSNESGYVEEKRIRVKRSKLFSLSPVPEKRHEESIEIIPVCSTDKNDEKNAYCDRNVPGVVFNENSESVRSNDRCDVFPHISVEVKNESISATSLMSDVTSVNPELVRQPVKQSAHETESNQDSIQGHWLSSLNNNNNNENNVEMEDEKYRHTCSICGATYKHLRNLRAHCHIHYGKTKCNLCHKVLCNISYFKKHLQQQHGLLMNYCNKRKNLVPTVTNDKDEIK